MDSKSSRFAYVDSMRTRASSIAWRLAIRYTLSRQRSRSVAFISRVAMAGVVLGVALLIVVLSVMNGFDRELRERVLSIMPQVTLYHSEGIEDWSALRLQLLTNDNDIVAAAPFVEMQGMVNAANNTEPLLIYGVDAQLESTVSIIEQFLAPGTLIAINKKEGGLVLGHTLAQKLDVSVGDSVNIIIPRAEGQSSIPAIQRMRLVDVLKTGTEIDGHLALMGMQTAQGLSIHPSKVSGLHIKGRDLFLSAEIAQQLQIRLPHGFYTGDWTRTHGNIYYAVKMSKKLVSLLLLLIIAIAAFNVVSTLVMVVIDKQGDIAILRTLGMSTRQTLSVFMIQGGLIGVIGTVLGAILGMLLALFTQNIVSGLEGLLDIQFLNSDIYPVSYLPSHILMSDVVWVVSVSILMSFLSTLYPAWRASKVKPAEALRYE